MAHLSLGLGSIVAGSESWVRVSCDSVNIYAPQGWSYILINGLDLFRYASSDNDGFWPAWGVAQ